MLKRSFGWIYYAAMDWISPWKQIDTEAAEISPLIEGELHHYSRCFHTLFVLVHVVPVRVCI